MKKTPMLILLLFSIFLVGCHATSEEEYAIKYAKSTPTWEKTYDPNRIYNLEVWTTAKNPEHIYHVKHPDACYQLTDEFGGSAKRIELENPIYSYDFTTEDYTFLVEYVESLAQSEQENGIPAYQIYMTYTDEDAIEKRMWINGYDVYPDGWEDFIACVNRLCGSSYLTDSRELQSLTPEFLTEVFDVTDEDVPQGTLQDVIDGRNLDFFRISSGTFYMENELSNYYLEINEEKIAPYRPKELVHVKSSIEEYDLFVKDYVELLGSSWKEVDSDQDYLRRLECDGMVLYIGRTADLKKLDIQFQEYNDTYQFLRDLHVEGMTTPCDFIYSQDQKYILVIDDSSSTLYVDYILKFLEVIPEV